MCKSKDILETLKKTKGHGGMTKAQISLAEAQAEDIESMKKEITDVKRDVSELRAEVSQIKVDIANMDGKLDLLIKQSENRPLLQIIKELINTKGLWIVLALIVIGIWGIDVSGLRGLLP